MAPPTGVRGATPAFLASTASPGAVSLPGEVSRGPDALMQGAQVGPRPYGGRRDDRPGSGRHGAFHSGRVKEAGGQTRHTGAALPVTAFAVPRKRVE